MSRNGNSRLSMNSFHRLQRRELNGKLPNSFWDYHLHVLTVDKSVTHLVIAHDIICVFCNGHLIPFGRPGKISALKHESGKPIILNCEMAGIESAYYNSNNNSVIIVGYHQSSPYLKILSVEVASIKAGRTNEYREIYAEEADTVAWDLDIRNCRGVIYNRNKRVLKVFDLKEYNQISTISLLGVPYGRGTPFLRNIQERTQWNFQSRGNMYVVIYYEGGFPRDTSDISFKIYSKQDGELRQEGIVHFNHPTPIKFAELCGNHTICVQHYGGNMEVIDISGEVPQVIPTNLEALAEPYYLHKLDRFLCYTRSQRLHVCNMRGDILITFEDHPRPLPIYYSGTYIAKEQDIIISVCYLNGFDDYCTINISSIITGKCLAKITTEGRSQIILAALSGQIMALAYDERTGEIFTANENGICCVWSKNFHSDSWSDEDELELRRMMKMMRIPEKRVRE